MKESNSNHKWRCVIAGIICSLCVIFSHPYKVCAQQESGISYLLYGRAERKLESGIKDMIVRKKAVAYNIANASTPHFKPIRFPDEIDEATRLYGDTKTLDTVNVDDEMINSTKIRLHHTAYVRLLSTKMQITKKIVTLGKGG